MGPDELPLAEQVAALERILRRNPVVVGILERMPALGLPDCWLAAGAVAQTVWNVRCGRDPRAGIGDYDLDYFDASDLSAGAEAAALGAAARVLDGLRAEIEIRNEARVHLWYEARFGAPCPPYRSTRHAITTFPATSSCVGVRVAGGRFEVFAPYGLTDLFGMVVRPNPVLAPAAVYEAKTARWVREWPQLTVLPWPAGPIARSPHRV